MKKNYDFSRKKPFFVNVLTKNVLKYLNKKQTFLQKNVVFMKIDEISLEKNILILNSFKQKMKYFAKFLLGGAEKCDFNGNG